MRSSLTSTCLAVLAFCFAVDGLHIFTATRNGEKANLHERKRRSAVGGNAKITSFHVDSKVTTRYARVAVTIVVENTSPSEGNLISMIMRLPKAAFISNFSMETEGKVYVGEVKESAAARAQFQQAVYQGQSTGLVSTTVRDTQSFDVSVNVAAAENVTFRLNYEELLERKLGIYHHVIYADLGQVVKDYLIEILISEPTGIASVEANVPAKGKKRGGDDGESISVRRSGTQAYVLYRPSASLQSTLGDSVININYDVTREQAGGQLITRDGYFIHWFAPSSLPIIPKNVVFIIDRSGSMSGKSMSQAIAAFRQVLDDLGPQDKFNVITFAGSATTWSSGTMVDASPENINRAKQFVSDTRATGSTAFYDAVIAGVTLLESLSSNDESTGVSSSMLIVLTDGQPTSGQIINTNAIVAAVTRRVAGRFVIFCLGFGFGVDQSFLKKLAERNKGTSRQIYQDSDAALQVKGFYDEVASPLLSQIIVKYEGCRVEKVTKDRFHHYFSGSEVMVGGRVENDNNCLGLNFVASVNGQSLSGQVTMETKGKDVEKGFVDETYDMERIWAYLTIKQLLDQKSTGDTSKDAEILRLSLQYNFVTDMTSMVVTQSGVGTSGSQGGQAPPAAAQHHRPYGPPGRSARPYPPARVYASIASAGPPGHSAGPYQPAGVYAAISPVQRSYFPAYPVPQPISNRIYGHPPQQVVPLAFRLYATPQILLHLFQGYSTQAATTKQDTTVPANTTQATTETPTTTETITTQPTTETATTAQTTTEETNSTVAEVQIPEITQAATSQCVSDIQVANETVLASPLYPDLYPSNSFCVWNVTKEQPRNDTDLELVFETMDLETGGDDCNRDSVSVMLDDSISTTRNFCGFEQTQSTSLIAKHSIVVVFSSDERVEGRGFAAKIRVV